MRFKSRSTGVALLGVFLALSIVLNPGCARDTVGIEAGSSPDTAGAYQQYLEVYQRSLARQIEITNISTRSVGGMLQHQVSLFNKKKKPVAVKYKFAWFDRDGMEVDVDTDAWTPLLLHGKEGKSVQGVAPNPSAISFKIRIMKQED